MRNGRGALWALGLAGAAYLWRNRGRLQQQVNQLGGRATTPSNRLPDYRSNDQYNGSNSQVEDTRSRSVSGSGPFGNTEV